MLPNLRFMFVGEFTRCGNVNSCVNLKQQIFFKLVIILAITKYGVIKTGVRLNTRHRACLSFLLTTKKICSSLGISFNPNKTTLMSPVNHHLFAKFTLHYTPLQKDCYSIHKIQDFYPKIRFST